MTKIKFCGLTREQDILAAVGLGVDYIGFVFAPSTRRVTFEQAAELRRLVPVEVKVVGVFVEPERKEVEQAVHQAGLDLIQLHGKIEETLFELGIPVIEALRSESDVRSSRAKLVLYDSAVAGSGTTFDWETKLTGTEQAFIAGGLTPGNVSQAIERYSPFGVDVSSGIETNGMKDEQKMEAFIQSVRGR
ncbi:phosphoribosylanthranilate isomerase [Exiguobacterium flavidum]|uniref:phosphoribosylanthranilate isomerase n=1 Tax=Exiguobacterium flavidum TaxID=2184695 RepID=UPI000DF76B1E|nr:phosphoribosylanthranilate isomerase [Exiguobacterium flavidum]